MKLEHILDTYNCIIPYEDMRVKVNRFTYTITDEGLFAPVHMHNDYEFHYIVSGKGHITIGDVEFDVGKGDIYITNPYVNHSEFSCESDPMVLYAIECQFEFSEHQKNKIDKFEISTISKVLEEVHYQAFHDNGTIINLLDCIRKENNEEKFGYFLLSKAMIMECIVRTIQLAIDNTDSIKLIKSKHRAYSVEMRASSIKNYIDVNITNNIGIEEICKYVFLSEKQINRLFCEKFDKTVSQYILDTRFEISKKLLVTTSDNLENIALNSGFTSYQQMYRVFVRKLNITPKQYRIKNVNTEI